MVFRWALFGIPASPAACSCEKQAAGADVSSFGRLFFILIFFGLG